MAREGTQTVCDSGEPDGRMPVIQTIVYSILFGMPWLMAWDERN